MLIVWLQHYIQCHASSCSCDADHRSLIFKHLKHHSNDGVQASNSLQNILQSYSSRPATGGNTGGYSGLHLLKAVSSCAMTGFCMASRLALRAAFGVKKLEAPGASPGT